MGDDTVTAALAISRLIDWINGQVGKYVSWLILLAVIIAAGNATVRYIFSNSSNAWLEVQWYLYSAVFLLCAGYTLLRNEHVRIDVVTGRFSRRTQVYIELFGTVFFLMPMAVMIMWLSWPLVVEAYVRHEISGDAGGLLRWPVKLLIPVGFGLLVLQGVSQFIKLVAFLLGRGPDPHATSASSHGAPAAGATS
jgi:TRAP-type mannitol/chloroaromatic compound transport system permease small subunit